MALPIKNHALQTFSVQNVSLDRKIHRFIERNTLVPISEMKKHELQHPCCPSCLKAHMVKSARELKIDAEEIEELKDKIEGEIGHSGYYLDAGALIKI